jgi:tetratricopeptide (TPR) repeat protein
MRSYTDALEIFERCVNVSPDIAQYHSDMGRALASLERYEEAVQAFDKALQLDRKNGPTWKYKGLALSKLGQQENAIACYNHAIDYGIEDLFIYSSKARALEELERYQDALENYQRALTYDDKDASLWARLGGIYAKTGDIERAADAIDHSLKLDPQGKKAWANRAVLMEKLGKDEEALKSYDNAIGLEPSDPFLWSGKGLVLLRLRSNDLAKRAFDKALELNPSLESAIEGRKIADEQVHQDEIATFAMKVLEAENRIGAEIGKEDAFRECGIPYSHLDEVFAFLEEPVSVNVGSLSAQELSKYEEASRRVLMAAYRSPSVARHGLKLADVVFNMTEPDMIEGKNLLAYIEYVNKMNIRSMPVDPETEKLLRKTLSLPEEKRSVIGIMESLGVGILTARQLMAMVRSFKTKGRHALPVRVKETEPEMTQVEIDSEENGESKDLVDRATERAEAREERPTPRRSTYADPDLSSNFYRDERKAEARSAAAEGDDFKGRRCLFHGGIAVMKCPNCSVMLCRECKSSGVCPRCKTSLGISRPARRAEEEEDEDHEEEQEQPEKQESQQRDYSRL